MHRYAFILKVLYKKSLTGKNYLQMLEVLVIGIKIWKWSAVQTVYTDSYITHQVILVIIAQLLWTVSFQCSRTGVDKLLDH